MQVGLLGAHLIHERRANLLKKQPRVFRVPLTRYRENLQRMIDLVRRIPAEPILVTAPSDIEPDAPAKALPFLDDLNSTGYETPKSLHDTYCEATRDVARTTGTRLADAATIFEGRTGLILKDHMHLTPAGIEQMAELLAAEVVASLGH